MMLDEIKERVRIINVVNSAFKVLDRDKIGVNRDLPYVPYQQKDTICNRCNVTRNTKVTLTSKLVEEL